MGTGEQAAARAELRAAPHRVQQVLPDAPGAGLSTDSGGSPAPGSPDRLHSAAQTPELRQRQGHRAINEHLRTTKPGFWAHSRPAPQTSQEPLLSLPLEGGPGGTQPGAPRELPREGLWAPLARGRAGVHHPLEFHKDHSRPRE